MSGGLEEPRRREVLRLPMLAGARLEEGHYDMLRFEATRADGRTVKDASMVCAAGVTVMSVPDSEAHWAIAASLRVSTKTLEDISDPRVRAAWEDMMEAEYICQDGVRAQ
jgi:hypothetical protein